MSVTVKSASPVEQLRTQLVAMTPEFKNALPPHIKPEKFQRVVMTVVQQQPDLLRADRRSLFAACVKCAADGLVPDGREAALVLFGSNVQYMPMLAGIQKRVRNSGEIASIQAHVIYENDTFVIQRGLHENIEHTPKFPGDRGKPIGAYAIAKFKDGSDPVFEVMDVASIERVRQISRAKNNGPWAQWWDEMARKSVFRRLSKWLPMDAEVDELVRRDDQIGAPTIETPEPSSEVMTLEADAFETAASGEGQTEDDPDPDLALAAGYVRVINDAKTQPAVENITKNAAIRRQMQGWKESKPELHKMVDDAAAAKMSELQAAV